MQEQKLKNTSDHKTIQLRDNMIWNIRWLTVKVTFEVTVSFKIVVWMEPEPVFVDREGIVIKNRQSRLVWEWNGYTVISTDDNDWATDDGGSNREIVNFKPDGNEMTWR